MLENARRNPDTLLRIQGDAPNKQYMRLLVPPGARIIDNRGYAISVSNSDDRFTQFSWYQTTVQNKSSNLSFIYALPQDRCDTDTTWYRQPGLQTTSYTQK